MSTKFKVIVSLLFLFSIAISCSNDKVTQRPINPNGDSELALLMREMFEEAMKIKKQIANGESIEINLDHHKILSAHATEPDKAASAEYKAFAQTYLQSVESLQTADKDQLVNLYDNLVKNCTSCHQALCPGPLVKIKKLR